jgi:hypothetical protein
MLSSFKQKKIFDKAWLVMELYAFLIVALLMAHPVLPIALKHFFPDCLSKTDSKKLPFKVLHPKIQFWRHLKQMLLESRVSLAANLSKFLR